MYRVGLGFKMRKNMSLLFFLSYQMFYNSMCKKNMFKIQMSFTFKEILQSDGMQKHFL